MRVGLPSFRQPPVSMASMKLLRWRDARGGEFVALPTIVMRILQSPPRIMLDGVLRWSRRYWRRGDVGVVVPLVVGGR